MKIMKKIGRTGEGVFVVWQTQTAAIGAIAAWLANIFFAAKPVPPIPHRACFAIVGPSAVGKTTLAIPLQQHMAKGYVPTTLIRRDSFIRGKNSSKRWFDDAAVQIMRQQVVRWLNSESSSGESFRIQNVPEPHCPLLPDSGIILFEDLRRMPELPLSGGICLVGDPAYLTRLEEKRNGVAWPWWEHLRRNFVKFRYQKHLLKCVHRSDYPWMVVSRNPSSGEFTGWMGRSPENGRRLNEK
jgi:hypothetical protein